MEHAESSTSDYTPPETQVPHDLVEADDVFVLSDHHLYKKIKFINEIGNGNWGSVWSCRPKVTSQEHKFAMKLVHRIPKIICTKKEEDRTDKEKDSIKKEIDDINSRVRSLWNEYKIVRTLRDDPHPSIIEFHSFLISPSFVMITMPVLPTPIPVEMPEQDAKRVFRSLLSAVSYLHLRGIVHNDIKPANIMLTTRNVPVLIDFGFGEVYDLTSPEAFHSNLKYGTPEYLSPERARGMPHDTRKADIWSLGVSFFEILTGRTPFEEPPVEGDDFTTEKYLQRYWHRTFRGKWIGEWKMSTGMEKLLKRMLAPNADLRYTATRAMADAYWSDRLASVSHKRSISSNSVNASPSVAVDKDMSKLLDIRLPSWSSRSTSNSRDKENLSRSQLPRPKENKEPRSMFGGITNHARSKSQPKAAAPKANLAPPKQRPPIPPLSPIKGSPPPTPIAPAFVKGDDKENSHSESNILPPELLNIAPRQVLGAVSSNLPRDRVAVKDKSNRRSAVFQDLTSPTSRITGRPVMIVKEKPKAKDTSANTSGNDSVRKRVNEWEREKERLREMERLEAIAKERDEELARAKKLDEEAEANESILNDSILDSSIYISSISGEPENSQSIQVAQVAVRAAAQIVPATPPSFANAPSFLDLTASGPCDGLPRAPGTDSGFSSFKQSLRTSIDKGVRLYKSSTLAQITGRTTPGPSASNADIASEAPWALDFADGSPWVDEVPREGESSMLGIHQAMQVQQDDEADTTIDRVNRLTTWMHNVDKIAEQTRQNFAIASPTSQSASALPIPPPMSRASSVNRTSRLPRKVLAASQIFTSDDSMDQTAGSSFAFVSSVNIAPPVNKTLPAVPAEDSTAPSSFIVVSTPPRARRATITTRSPEGLKTQASFDLDTGSPSKRKEKSKSQGNLLRPIQTIERLELELKKDMMPTTSPRLSAVIDSSVFIAPPHSADRDDSTIILNTTLPRSKSLDIEQLTASPVHVDPYPPRKSDVSYPVVQSPKTRKNHERVYDRFLMATSGVKRVGRGYQSDNVGPVQSSLDPRVTTPPQSYNHNHRVFNSARRAMPPPVSSDDFKSSTPVDEFGLVACRAEFDTPAHKDDANNTVAFVRRAFKTMVTGKTVTRRLSRTAVA